MPSRPVITKEVAPLPAVAEDAHKGSVGRIVIIGGCHQAATGKMMIGAPALAAGAAFRCGAGLVELVVPASIQQTVAILAPCATTRTMPSDADGLLAVVADFRADAVALGPGMGDSMAPHDLTVFLERLDQPVVIDADALNQLAQARDRNRLRTDRAVLTPHMGEAKRLLQAAGVDPPVDRRDFACALVTAYDATVVLKGPGTIVTDGKRIYVNETGNSGLATGGTGDVLTGVIAALLGRAMPVLEAAILGVYLHGLAGDFAAAEFGRRSLMALDVIDFLPEAINEHESPDLL